MKGRIFLEKRVEDYYTKRLSSLSNGESIRVIDSNTSEIDLLALEILEVAKQSVEPSIELTKDDAYKFMFRLHDRILKEDLLKIINQKEPILTEKTCEKIKSFFKKISLVRK